MTDRLMIVGNSVIRLLFESIPKEYLSSVFSEDMGIDDLIDQIILELVKYAYDSSQEKHSIRYYLGQLGDAEIEAAAMRYSRLQKLANEYKNRELDYFESQGFSVEDARPPQMQDMNEKLDGYRLSEMNLFEITNIGDLELIKAIINHRLHSAKKVSNNQFRDIAGQYDKFAISLKEQCNDSDEKMVFNSLAYYTLEWKYAFDFIYQCAASMERSDCTDPIEVFSKTGILLGYRFIDSVLGFSASADSRMVGYREKLIPFLLRDKTVFKRYAEQLALLAQIKENAIIDGVPIKQWFVENTGIHDWASFFREYNVFRCRNELKDYSNKIIRNMRGLINLVFPENPENRYYSESQEDDTIGLQFFEEVIPMVKLDCYIEEYQNDAGALCARLRDKASNKCVIIQGDEEQKEHLLRFLSSARRYSEVMPTVFCRDGTDVVAVRGQVKNEDSDSIELSLEAPGAGYLFQ